MATVISLIRKPTLRLSPVDDVVIAARPIKAGLVIEQESISAHQDIPAGHKMAVKAVPKGSPVKRYGQIIGFATEDIAVGDHVHTHNLVFNTFERDYCVGVDVKPTPNPAQAATFRGYLRADEAAKAALNIEPTA